MLPFGRLIQRTWLLYLSKPPADRALYRAVRGRVVRSVVEIGLPDLVRTQRLWEALSWHTGNLPLCYAAIDPFDSRTKNQPVLSLKQAHAKLRHTQVHVKLIPGDAPTALHRTANSLTGTDLLLISRGVDADALSRSWQWIPRMLHAGTIILQETDAPGAKPWQRLSIVEVQQRAKATKETVKTRKAA